jgi:hypothetical protein
VAGCEACDEGFAAPAGVVVGDAAQQRRRVAQVDLEWAGTGRAAVGSAGRVSWARVIRRLLASAVACARVWCQKVRARPPVTARSPAGVRVRVVVSGGWRVMAHWGMRSVNPAPGGRQVRVDTSTWRPRARTAAISRWRGWAGGGVACSRMRAAGRPIAARVT